MRGTLSSLVDCRCKCDINGSVCFEVEGKNLNKVGNIKLYILNFTCMLVEEHCGFLNI